MSHLHRHSTGSIDYLFGKSPGNANRWASDFSSFRGRLSILHLATANGEPLELVRQLYNGDPTKLSKEVILDASWEEIEKEATQQSKCYNCMTTRIDEALRGYVDVFPQVLLNTGKFNPLAMALTYSEDTIQFLADRIPHGKTKFEFRDTRALMRPRLGVRVIPIFAALLQKTTDMVCADAHWDLEAFAMLLPLLFQESAITKHVKILVPAVSDVDVAASAIPAFVNQLSNDRSCPLGILEAEFTQSPIMRALPSYVINTVRYMPNLRELSIRKWESPTDENVSSLCHLLAREAKPLTKLFIEAKSPSKEFITTLINGGIRQSSTLCSFDLIFRNPGEVEGPKAKTGRQMLVEYLVQDNNTTLSHAVLQEDPVIMATDPNYQKIYYYTRLNHYGRAKVRELTTTVEDLIELLVAAEGDRWFDVINILYGLLQEAPDMFWTKYHVIVTLPSSSPTTTTTTASSKSRKRKHVESDSVM